MSGEHRMRRTTHAIVILISLGCLLFQTKGAPPVFTWPADDGSTVVTIDENDEGAGAQTLSHTLSATPANASYAVTYSITAGDTALFEITSPGVLLRQKPAATFDFESGTTSYSLTIRASDGTENKDVTLTVNINDLNDETPTQTGTCATTVPEEQAPGTIINITCTFTDADAGDALTYTLSGNHKSFFQIDSSSGQFRSAKRLDYDATPTVTVYNQLTLAVEDGNSHSVTTTVTVTLTDINDNTPICQPNAYFSTITESAASGTTVATMTCSDADSGSNKAVTYTTNNAAFTVDTTSGVKLKTAATLDYETTPSYTVVITMVDGGTPALTASATAYVTVTNENEADPAWGTFVPAYTSATTPYPVSENAPLGTSVVKAVVTDADNDDVLCSIVSVTDNAGGSAVGVFRMETATNILQTTAILERDGTNGRSHYDVVIRATDNGSPARSVERTIRVGITDYNDNPPKFSFASFQTSTTEGAAADTDVILLPATDADTTSTLAYAITSGNTDKFKFDTTTKNQLKIKTAIDLDADTGDAASYTLVATVTDGGSPELTGSTTVFITVTPSNDHDPVFGTTTPTGTISTAENQPSGTAVAKVTASDKDYGSDGAITYSIIGGDSNKNFQIDPSSGDITVKSPIDKETTGGPVTLTIKAQDGGSSTRTATTTVQVTITDVSDNNPVCSPAAHALTVDEDKAANFVVVTLACTDADSGDNLTYSIHSGNTGSKFQVSSSGVVTLAAQLDYDSSDKSYSLVARVTDGTNNVDVPVTVTVGPVNEQTPSFASNPTLPKAEDTATNTVLTTYTATDTDHAPHNVVKYHIDSVDNGGTSLFSIDQTSAEIKLAKSLDYETEKSYEIVVVATDGANAKGTGTVTISVSDVNDNAPSCTTASWSLSTAENAGSLPVTLVANMGCTDSDTAPNSDLTYTLVQTPAGAGEFSVSSSGAVTMTKALDYESVSFYSLTVTVKDGGPSPGLSVEVPITISVTDVNDGPPTFTGTHTKSIAENAAVGTAVYTLAATDPDNSNSKYGALQYSISSGNTGDKFQINPDSGLITVASTLDRETDASYELVVKAAEESGDNTASATLTVSVTDINDNPPSCQVMTFTKSIAETSTPPGFIQYLDCSDPDNPTLTYTVSSGDTSVFSVSNGSVSVPTALDYESGTHQKIATITVSDGTHSVDVSGSITITPVNEAPPVLGNSGSFKANISETSALGTLVQTITATDTDSSDTGHGVISYSFSGGPYPKFAIDATSGAVTVAGPLDYEQASSYTVTVRASDSDNTVSGTLVITIVDENDNAPVFNPTSYSATVAENSAANAAVATVTATDADSTYLDNNAIVYSITSGNTGNFFQINAANGAITTTATAINYETSTSYTLKVAAKDKSGGTGALAAEATIVVDVTAVNEFAPVFNPASYTPSLSESTSPGHTVTTVAASDADDGLDGEVIYSMPTHLQFSLGSSSGKIILTSDLDYETTQTYTLTVTASDRGSPVKTATVAVVITVTDVNDNSPECTLSTHYATLREDAVSGTFVVDASCSDKDSGVNGQITYSIPSGSPFQVNSTGTLTTSGTLDYETTTSYSVTVSVRDGGSPANTASVEVRVTVTDINENAPVFSNQISSINVAESASVGTLVATITATDADSQDIISYNISPASPKFTIDSGTGKITVKSTLDHETTSSYTLVINATDSGTVDAQKHATHTLTVSVTNSNDHSPVFSPASYSAPISENDSAGKTVVTVTATDGDTGDTISYSIASGNTGNVFRLDANSLVIDSVAKLDYETLTSYSLVVTASDGTNTATANIQVTVGAYNEFAPVITPIPTLTIQEDTAYLSNVTQVKATDADSGNDGVLSYVIVSGAANTFAIDSNTGVITVIGDLDRETTTSYAVVVHAKDEGTSPGQLSSSLTININIGDVNDNKPICSPSTITVSLAENSAATSPVTTLACSDADDDPNSLNNKVQYSITGGNTASNFAVDATSGAVTVAAGASLDKEASTNSYSLTISAADSGTPPLSTSVTVNVELTGVNEHDPVFTPSAYSVQLAEDASTGTNVTTVNAADADAGSDGVVSFSIISGNGDGKFQIDPTSGLIKTKASLDRETTGSYTLNVRAADQGSPSKVATTSVQISVTDVNDNKPVFTTSVYSGTIAENAATSDVVLTVVASDADNGTNSAIAYSIISGNTGNVFNVDASSGVVKVAAALDCETVNSYSLTVRASDGATSPLTEDTTVVIEVTDINEHAPVFTPSGTVTATVNESENPGFIVANVNASDPDCSASNGVVTYSITSGNGDGSFSINPTEGVVSLAKGLDRETLDQYTIGIQASDGTRTSSMTLSVGVADFNDGVPNCGVNPYVANISESASVGASVIDLTCTDHDSETVNQIKTYTITSGNTDTAFAINSGNGKITLNNAVDYETLDAYSLTVTVADGGSPALTGTVVVSVDITAVNEHTPVFSGSYSETISENTPLQTIILTIQATDADTGIHGQIRYSVVSGNIGNKFHVNENTGNITVVDTLDRETQASYSLTVRATDSLASNGDEKYSETTVSITISDANDNFPVFVPASYSTSVQEDTATNAQIITLTVNDDDDGVNGQSTLSIVSGNTDTTFSISGKTIVLAKSLDYETVPKYTLVVKATDGGTPALTADTVVIVSVINKNEYTPDFSITGNVVDLAESVPVGTVIYTATATDQDSGKDGEIRYDIGPQYTDTFSVDPSSGKISTIAQLDFDTAPTIYYLNITATDNGGQGATALMSTLNVTVVLSDVNDNYPVCTKNTYSVTLNEDASIGDTVVIVVATDNDSDDNGKVSFTIDSGDGAANFQIDNSTGIMTLVNAVDYEQKNLYSLGVKVSDSGSPSLSSICYVKVTIVDVNDNTPDFTIKNLPVSVQEELPANTFVTNIYVNDLDSGANGEMVITQTSSNSFFTTNQISNTQAQLITKHTLDRETTESYTVRIKAVDKGNPVRSSISTVYVTLDDINDNDPQTVGEPFEGSISEDSTPYTYVLSLNASDTDKGENGRLTYTIISGNEKGHFALDADTGMLQFANGNLDRETDASFVLKVNVSDNGTPSRWVQTTAKAVILDVNDNTPIFSKTSYDFDVIENSGKDTSVGQIPATDADTGENAVLTYSFVQVLCGKNLFTVDSATGKIFVVTPPDREDTARHCIRYMVRDNGTPQRYATVDVTFTVLDRNDNNPIFTSASYAADITENAGSDVDVITVSATDADLADNAKIVYSISSSLRDGSIAVSYFTINETTGSIKTLKSLDRETYTTLTFVVIATDQGVPNLSNQAEVVITVKDVNDNAPVFTPSYCNSEIPADERLDYVICSMQATDRDEGTNADLLFTFQTVAYFDLKTTNHHIGNGTGNIVQTENQYPPTKQRYLVNLTATDGGQLKTTVKARIDTFTSTEVVVDFHLNIKLDEYNAKMATFLESLRKTLLERYPHARVKHYHAVTRTVVTKITSINIRRLLQSDETVTADYSTAMVYALCNNNTDDSNSVSSSKCWIKKEELLSLWQRDPDGTPSTAITGSSSLEDFKVTGVHEHPEPYVTPWILTPEGIAVLTTCCFLYLLIVVVIIILCVRWKRKKRPVTPSRVSTRERNPTPIIRDDMRQESDYSNDMKKKHPAPSVLALQMPTARKMTVNHGATKPSTDRIYYDKNVWHARSNSLMEDKESTKSFSAKPKEQFDGRAIDPTTGKMYEYNSKTNERRWVKTPEGHAVVLGDRSKLNTSSKS